MTETPFSNRATEERRQQWQELARILDKVGRLGLRGIAERGLGMPREPKAVEA